MNRSVVKTGDHSSTLFVPELDQHYHSIHGALQESQHVFIEAGLLHMAPLKSNINILEVGLGTGLNVILSAIEAKKLNINIRYKAIEKYPVEMHEMQQLNYAEILSKKSNYESFSKIHTAPWERWIPINPEFELYKSETDLKEFKAQNEIDLIYFDAFAPSAQPDLWTIDIFKKMYASLKPGGLLVTYCVKGEIRRNMKSAGFEVEKIPGPPGKREMARAFKRN